MNIYIHICTYIYLRARPRAGPWALGRCPGRAGARDQRAAAQGPGPGPGPGPEVYVCTYMYVYVHVYMYSYVCFYICFLRMLLTYASYVCFLRMPLPPHPSPPHLLPLGETKTIKKR